MSNMLNYNQFRSKLKGSTFSTSQRSRLWQLYKAGRIQTKELDDNKNLKEYLTDEPGVIKKHQVSTFVQRTPKKKKTHTFTKSKRVLVKKWLPKRKTPPKINFFKNNAKIAPKHDKIVTKFKKCLSELYM